MTLKVSSTNSVTSFLPGSQPALTGYAPALRLEPDPSLSRKLSCGGSYVLDLVARLAALAKKIQVRQNKKRLRVCESVPLGDKRFVAVIQVDDQQFLLGGSSTSISLLAQLEKPAEFARVLNACAAEVNS